jgi:hypothetical protein
MTDFEQSLEAALEALEHQEPESTWEELEQWLLEELEKPTPAPLRVKSAYHPHYHVEHLTKVLNRVEDRFVRHYENTQRKVFDQSLARALTHIDDQTGLDVAAWKEDVRRYVIKLFSGRLRAADVEIEDAIQEVLLGLEIRNHGICPWRPTGGRTKAAYVFMVTEGVVRNMARKRLHRTQGFVRTLRHHMLPGMGNLEDLEPKSWISEEDRHQFFVEQVPERTPFDPMLVEDLEKVCSELPEAYAYVKHMVEGGKRYELLEHMKHRTVTKLYHTVRDFLLLD